MRVVILGCGTGVGKTRVSVALLRELVARGEIALGSKPVESGLAPSAAGLAASDAQALASAGSVHAGGFAPAYSFPDPVSPHQAARAAGVTVDIERVREWLLSRETAMATRAGPHRAVYSIVETAGGVYSPLSTTATNLDLARALEPATWVLVAADALGALHDVSACLQAMQARGRIPDHVVLSGAREPDASTGGNAAELVALGICRVSAVLARNDDRGVAPLVDVLLR